MLKVSISGISYHRSLRNGVDETFTMPLKKRYDYSFIVSYDGFSDSDYELVEKNTGLIYLNEDLETITKRFNSSTRKQIRRTLRNDNGLSIHHDISDFNKFYDFYRTCENERSWFPVPKEELMGCKIIYACLNGVPIYGISCYLDNDIMRLGRIFSRRRSGAFGDIQSSIISSAARRIIYEYCSFGLENDYSTLDLGGVDLDTISKGGITQFKMSFGIEVKPVIIGRYRNAKFLHFMKEAELNKIDIT